MSSNFNCSYMARSSLTCIQSSNANEQLKKFLYLVTAAILNGGQGCRTHYWKGTTQGPSQIWVEIIFGWPTFKIMCNTPIFYFNFRCQIENQVSDYRLQGASSFVLFFSYFQQLFKIKDPVYVCRSLQINITTYPLTRIISVVIFCSSDMKS
jgi:hypothetical protein